MDGDTRCGIATCAGIGCGLLAGVGAVIGWVVFYVRSPEPFNVRSDGMPGGLGVTAGLSVVATAIGAGFLIATFTYFFLWYREEEVKPTICPKCQRPESEW